jgi:hypothetical protein
MTTRRLLKAESLIMWRGSAALYKTKRPPPGADDGLLF